MITVIIDGAGRAVIGEKVSETDTTLTLSNPAVMHAQQKVIPNNPPQLELSLFPLFLKEFTVGDGQTEWEYKKANIAVPTKLQLNPQIVSQYQRVFTPQVISPPTQQVTNPPVIKLFD